MKEYYGIYVSEETFEFIKAINDYVDTNFGVLIASAEHSLYIEPIDNFIEISCGECKGIRYPSVEKFLLNFEIEGKKMIEIIENFDFA